MLNASLRQDPGVAAIFAALEASPDPVFATDRRNRIVFWNDAARAFLGYDADDTVGRPCSEVLKGCDDYGNRYCSDDCPIVHIASRDEVIQPFSLRLLAKDHHVAGTSIGVLQLRTADDEILLLHLLRPQESEPAKTSAPVAATPHLVARESTDARARKLTAREVEVLGMLAAGRSTPEISDRLHISQLTTRDHIQHILEKLEVHSKAEAVAFAFQKNLI